MSSLQSATGERKQLADQIEFLQEKLQSAAVERDSMSSLVKTLKEVNARLEQRLDEAQRAQAEAIAAAQLQQQHAEPRSSSSSGSAPASLLEELSTSAQLDDRAQRLQQELELARSAAANQLEQLSSRLRVLESELAAARAQATQMISLAQEQELKQKLSAEEAARQSLERALIQLQEESAKQKADLERAAAENLALKAAKQGEQEVCFSSSASSSATHLPFFF